MRTKNKQKPRWPRPRFYLDLAVSCLALFLVLKAGISAKIWQYWEWHRWSELGPKFSYRPTYVSLEKAFAQKELGEKLRQNGNKIAIWSWDKEHSHGHDFFLPIQVNWFLLPHPQEIPLVKNAAQAQAYDWIIDSESKKYQLEKGDRAVRPHWEKESLYIYELETAAEKKRKPSESP